VVDQDLPAQGEAEGVQERDSSIDGLNEGRQTCRSNAPLRQHDPAFDDPSLELP
jgi:hypothetical protein